MLTCAAEPAVPPAPVTDAARDGWESDLIAAGCDCRHALAAVKALLAGQPAPANECGQ